MSFLTTSTSWVTAIFGRITFWGSAHKRSVCDLFWKGAGRLAGVTHKICCVVGSLITTAETVNQKLVAFNLLKLKFPFTISSESEASHIWKDSKNRTALFEVLNEFNLS